MSKAHSLVDVLVRDTFVHFPVDAERYELSIVLAEFADAEYCAQFEYGYPRQIPLFGIEEATLKEVFRLCDQIELSADLYAQHASGSLPDPTPSQARRIAQVMRSFDQFDSLWERGEVTFDNAEQVEYLLTRFVVRALRS